MEYVIYLLVGVGFGVNVFEKETEGWLLTVLAALLWPVVVGQIIYNNMGNRND